MKQQVSILSLFLLLAACTQHKPATPMPEAPMHTELAAIDTLMQSQPDSALSAILPFFGSDTLTPYDRHYANLLLSEALFKCDYEQTTRPALLEAMAYFDSLAAAQPKSEDFFLLSARAHYMNGVGLVEADSVVEACAEYLHTLQMMEERYSEDELIGQKAKFMALTYNRLGQMFSDHLMTEQALVCFKQALTFLRTCPISKYSLPQTMVFIGTHFSMLSQPDSAYFYFDMAEELLPDTSNIIFRNILTSRTILMYEKKMIEKNEALSVLSSVSDLAETEQEKVDRELIISEILYKENQIDSAQTCLEKVFYSETDILSKIQAARYLSEIHTKKKEHDKSDYYKSFLAPLAVESYEQKNKDSQMVELFENHEKQTLQIEHRKESASLRRKAIVTFLVFALVVIPIIIFAQKRKHLRKMDSAKKEFEQEKQQHTALVNRMQNANARLREENRRLSETAPADTPQNGSPNLDDFEALMHEPTCLELLGRFSETDIVTTNSPETYAGLSLSKADEKRIDMAMERHCPDFSNRIAALHPDLGKAELKMCKYLLLGLNEPQIAVLMQNTFTSTWKKTANIRKKMGCSDIRQHLKSELFEAKKA